MKQVKKKLMEVQTQAQYINIDEIQKMLDDKKAIKDYAYILHDKDVYNEDDVKKNPSLILGEAKPPHYHFALRLDNAYTFACVASWFGLAENFACKVKGEWVDMLKYLTHQNAPNKFQYSENEVISNYAWADEKAKLINKSNGEERKKEIINGIVDAYSAQTAR